MKHTISCRDSVYGNQDDAFRLLPDADITHTEITRIEPDRVAEVQKRAAANGVTISTIGSGVDLGDETSMATYRLLIDAVSAEKIRLLFTSIKGKDEAARSTYLERLRSLAEHAHKCGVTICMETHPPFGTNARTATETLTAINNPALGFNFDTANIYYYNQETTAVKELQEVRNRVVTVHLKDTDGGFKSGNFPVIGQGVVDYPAVFRLLDEINFSGPFTLELEGPLVSKKTTEQRHQAVKDCMAYLRSIGAV